MNAIDGALARLRADREASDPRAPIGDGMRGQGVGFAAIGGPLHERWAQAVAELGRCVRAIDGNGPVLHEGGVYHGSWIESTGTISVEILSRFAPEVARATHLLFASHQREDGLIPYKVTVDGPAFSQIQIVTPLARTVWHHYLLTGRDRVYLSSMYAMMTRCDTWLATYRDTRSTGGVEAFCTFDTGHDLSPRFWFVPDRCFQSDATRWDPDSPILPFVAPDLTGNVACQRGYLALIAAELGESAEPWLEKRRRSLDALWRECFDAEDEMFYDRDRNGDLVRIASDVLLRVLACEVGDDDFFARALDRHLMNTRRFLAHYGFTSLAMDDPRFDHDHTRNSWGGPVNFLTLLRAPHAFDAHERPAELALSTMPVLSAVANADRFPQCLDPWTGSPGYTELYSPAILWFLDAIERWTGVLPRPDGTLWFTGLAPTRLDHGAAATAVAYARTVGGVRFESASDDERTVVFRDGVEHMSFPRGWRVVTDRAGEPTAVIGVVPRVVDGVLRVGGQALSLALGGNERVDVVDRRVVGRRPGGVIGPHSGPAHRFQEGRARG